jgi:clan AA aspartic protease
MNGFVDSAGRALLEIDLKRARDTPAFRVTAWIDTGFTGDLVLPQTLIEELSLPLIGTVGAVLADGSYTAMEAYECFIEWFDELQRLEIVANDGKHALLGVGLLLDRELQIDYRSKTITLE